jgi:ribonuclease BN (tRNA processing enzyme)
MRAAKWKVSDMRIQFVGCGDAFGSGGRFNTCFHVAAEGANFLIDCGATSLVGLKRLHVERNPIDAILFSHFHHDHFGGVPFFIEDAQLIAKRTRPLLLAGPPNLPARYATMMEAAFPGSTQMRLRFPLSFREFAIGEPTAIGPLKVTVFPVRHDDRAGPCLAYRIEADGKVLAFSGDTEWTDTLIEAARGADLFICECYVRDKSWKGHLSKAVIREKIESIAPRRVILTHMGEDVLDNPQDIPFEIAEDGKIVEF